MILRAAKISDIDDIMQVERTSFASAVCETRETFAKRIRTCKNCFLIFEDDAAKNGGASKPRIAGYFSAERWRYIPESDGAFSLGHDAEKAHTDDGRILYLSSFALRPAWRGKGVGKTLFSRSLEWFCEHNDIDTLLLLVSEAWGGAVHIYEQAGFRLFRSIPDFFTDDSSAKHAGLVMVKAQNVAV